MGARHPQYRGGRIRRVPVSPAVEAAVRARCGDRCSYCNRPEGENLDRHGRPRRLAIEHVRPYRTFLEEHGPDRGPALANDPGNLCLGCLRCNARKSSVAERRARRGDLLDQRRYERLATEAPR